MNKLKIQTLKWVACASVCSMLLACQTIDKVSSGAAVQVAEKLTVTPDVDWNQFRPGLGRPFAAWTQDGLWVDRVIFVGGIADGKVLHDVPKDKTPPVFRASMSPQAIADLYHGTLRMDGSTVETTKLEPSTFLGTQGFRVEYTWTRKSDDVVLSGVSYGAVIQGKLYMLDFVAPRMHFHQQHLPAFERLVRTARVQG